MSTVLMILVEEALASSSERRFLSICSTGRRLNSRRERLFRLEGETITDWIERSQRQLDTIARRDSCFEYPSCISCPKGQDMLLASVARTDPHWDIRHVETALKSLAQYGPDRALPSVCEIGSRLSDLLRVQSDLGISLAESIEQVEGQFACTKTTTCMHCELGRGIFREMLFDLAENGLEGVYGPMLREQHTYL